MKLFIASDIHCEFHEDRGAAVLDKLAAQFKESECDVFVCAGDLADAACIGNALQRLCARIDPELVIYVFGNHEHYGSSIRETSDRAEALSNESENLLLLNNGVVSVGPGALRAGAGTTRFFGGTLWWKPQPDDFMYAHLMNDFVYIDGIRNDVERENRAFRDGLNAADNIDVVISHHLPSYKCVPAQYARSSLNRFYVSDCEDLIMKKQPKLWVCGHSHGPCDVMIGNTRVVRSPMGYPGEREDFQPLIVELRWDTTGASRSVLLQTGRP